MEFKTDKKIIDAATLAPKLFVSASLGDGGDYVREPGIQLTKEQIISLRKYEVLGLSLPVRLQDVIAYLNYGAGDTGTTGITAKDFQRTFAMTYDHARRWSPLREKIMLTGTDLKVFSGSILRIGNAIVEVYEDLKASRYLEQHNITTPEDYQKLKLNRPDLPDLDLAPGDVADIKYFLNDLLGKVKVCHGKAETVRAELDSFGTDMRQDVLPEIQLRLKLVSNNKYQADIEILQKDINRRAAEIDELNKQYEHMVQEAIKAAATLNIGGLILGIYQGVKAENLRKSRNRLKDEQGAANQLMASKNQTLSSLNRVRDDLQNLSYVAIEAELATQNLMQVWNALNQYITSSMSEVNNVVNAVSLRRFIGHIKGVVEPWEEIKVSSDALLKIFAEAEKEYKAVTLTFQGRNMMMAALNNTFDSDFDIERLVKANAAVQESSINTQALFAEYDYLSGTVGTMKGLADSINGTTFRVRELAQKNRIDLQQTVKKLKGYQAELGDPADTDEIHEDMEAELHRASHKIVAQAADLKATQRGISNGYDRRASQQWVAGLQADRLFEERRQAEVDQELDDLSQQMRSVAEAISLVEKAGVQKIGEEVMLTKDSLTALGMAPPQVQVALLAVETLKKLVSGIGSVISYLNMVAGYGRLKEKAAELRTKAAKYAKRISQIDGRMELVKSLDELDERRWAYTTEFSGVAGDFERFSREFKSDDSLPVEERVEMAISQAGAFVRYLAPFSR